MKLLLATLISCLIISNIINLVDCLPSERGRKQFIHRTEDEELESLFQQHYEANLIRSSHMRSNSFRNVEDNNDDDDDLIFQFDSDDEDFPDLMTFKNINDDNNNNNNNEAYQKQFKDSKFYKLDMVKDLHTKHIKLNDNLRTHEKKKIDNYYNDCLVAWPACENLYKQTIKNTDNNDINDNNNIDINSKKIETQLGFIDTDSMISDIRLSDDLKQNETPKEKVFYYKVDKEDTHDNSAFKTKMNFHRFNTFSKRDFQLGPSGGPNFIQSYLTINKNIDNKIDDDEIIELSSNKLEQIDDNDNDNDHINDHITNELTKIINENYNNENEKLNNHKAKIEELSLKLELEIPWQKFMMNSNNFGFSIDSIKGIMTKSPIKQFNINKSDIKIAKQSYQIMNSINELTSKFNHNIELNLLNIIKPLDLETELDFTSNIEYSNNVFYILAEYEIEYPNLDLPNMNENLNILPDALELAETNPDKFRNTYGDYIVVGGKKSASFKAIIACKSTEYSDLKLFKSKLSLGIPKLLNLNGKTEFEKMANNYNIFIGVNVLLNGYKGVAPSLPHNLTELLHSLEWFKHHEEPIYTTAYLKHISTIDGLQNVPSNIKIDVNLLEESKKTYSDSGNLILRSKNLRSDLINTPILIETKKQMINLLDLATIDDSKSIYNLQNINEKMNLILISLEKSSYLINNNICKHGYLEPGVFEGPDSSGRKGEWKCGLIKSNFNDKIKVWKSTIQVEKFSQQLQKKYKQKWKEYSIDFDKNDNSIILGIKIRSKYSFKDEWFVSEEKCLFSNSCIIRFYGVEESRFDIEIYYI